MGIDKETKASYVYVQIDNNPKYLRSLFERASEEGMNEKGELGQLLLREDTHSWMTSEYYYDAKTNELEISGEMTSNMGKSFVHLNIPLSEIVFLDILQESVRRLNKLKTVLESLKGQ